MHRFANLVCAISVLGTQVASGAVPVGLNGVSRVEFPDAVVDIERWAHPSGDRLVALTADGVYAVDPVSNTVTRWLEVGGNSLASAGEHVYVCGNNGLTKLHNSTATVVWEGSCDELALGATIWVQSGTELIGLGWTDYQQTERIAVEPGFGWSLAGDRIVQWRSDPGELRVHGPAGAMTFTPDHSVKSLVQGFGGLRWLGGDGRILADPALGTVPLEPPADRLIALDDDGQSYAAVYLESRAIGLLDSQGSGTVLLPTMVSPERVVPGDFDHDGCLDFMVVAGEASWIQTRCQAAPTGTTEVPSPEAVGLLLADEWFTHDLTLGEPVELQVEASAGTTHSLDGLPPGLAFEDGMVVGVPESQGMYAVTAMISGHEGGGAAAGFTLRVVGDGLVEADTYIVPAPSQKRTRPDCVMGIGAMMGLASARTDWFNLTGEPYWFGSPTVSALCGRPTEKKLRFVYGADSSPTAMISDGQLKLIMGTAGLHLGTPRVGAGVFASLGLVSVATGVRVVWMPVESKRNMPHGVEFRAAWLPATPDAGEFGISYSWQVWKRTPKEKR